MPSLRWMGIRLGILAFAILFALASFAQSQQPASPAENFPSAQPAPVNGNATQAPAPGPQENNASTSAEKKDEVTKDGKKPQAGPDATLRLSSGDLVEVNVYNVPELTTKGRVSEGGDLYLPLIDYVHVAGLTSDEAQEAIEKRLAEGGYVKSPHVTLFVDQYASQNASVLGEVMRPGVYPILGHQRLFDLISTSGGLTDKAGKSVTVTHRNQPESPVTVPLARNLTDTPDSNIDVFPGDTVIVRKADIVYVVGDVNRPSGILIDRGSLSVLQAIALAGGTTRTSKPGGARIIHKNSGGPLTETPVPLKKILEAKAPDIAMNPDDILFVPSSAVKLALQDNASIAMQAASLSLVGIR